MTADTRQPYPRCHRPDGCNGEHLWHGLECHASATCTCPSPWDDDYWKDGVQ